MNAFMREGWVAGAGVLLAISIGTTAFGQGSTPPANPPAQPNSSAQADNSDQPQPQRTIQMVRTLALLNNTLDAKKAKQGEPVTAKLAHNVQIPDQQALPKNTILEGHVDQAQPSEHKSDSTLVVTFDKAKLKDGQELAIKATIIAVSEPPSFEPQSQPSAGGGMGSGGGSPVAPASPTMPGSANVPNSTPQPINPTPMSTNSQPSSNPQTPAGVPGVVLQSDIHEHSSATFTSKGKNVHVPDGTQMQVAIAIIPAGVNIQ